MAAAEPAINSRRCRRMDVSRFTAALMTGAVRAVIMVL